MADSLINTTHASKLNASLLGPPPQPEIVMSQALLVILGIYLLACYAYGVVVLVQAWSRKTVVHPTSKLEPVELIRAAKQELEQDEQRLAA